MEIKSKKIKYSLIIPIILLLTTSVAVAAYYIAESKDSRVQQTAIDTLPPTEEQITDGQNTKQDTIESDGKPNLTNDTPSDPVDSTIPLTLSAINQTDSALQIRILINKILGDGSCTLLLTKEANTMSRTASIASMPSSSTCQGFDIATSELSAGTWHYQVTVTSGDETGTINGNTEIR